VVEGADLEETNTRENLPVVNITWKKKMILYGNDKCLGGMFHVYTAPL
jgi:hypothetical protein